MEGNYQLVLDLIHYWRCGTGKGSGAQLDSIVEVDEKGCPLVPGRMLKGLLRDAVHRTSLWNSAGFSEDRPSPLKVVEILFGSAAYEENSPRRNTQEGRIRVGSAIMNAEERQWLSENPTHQRLLFRELYSTAIRSNSGVARKGSLRGEQVVIPLRLCARVSFNWFDLESITGEARQQNNWIRQHENKILSTAVPLITAIGSGRTRGLGRLHASLEKSS